MPATTAEAHSLVATTVSVAPLVLLSAADHYGRSAKGTRKRVVGVLLGQNEGKNVRVSNSFAGKDRALAPQWNGSDLVRCSAIRGRREGPISMVPGPQLRRVDERHVQEGEREGEVNWMVSFGTQVTGVGFGDQRAVQEIYAQPAVGNHRCSTKGGWRTNGCILRSG